MQRKTTLARSAELDIMTVEALKELLTKTMEMKQYYQDKAALYAEALELTNENTTTELLTLLTREQRWNAELHADKQQDVQTLRCVINNKTQVSNRELGETLLDLKRVQALLERLGEENCNATLHETQMLLESKRDPFKDE